jgi:hypothetical protein
MGSGMQSGSRPLYEVLMELLNTPAITEEHLRCLLNEQPALLEPETQTLLAAIAEMQTSAAAREQVLRLGNLFDRMSRLGVNAAIVQETVRVRDRTATERRIARLRAKREEFRALKRSAVTQLFDDTQQLKLPSLAERFADLKQRAGSERPLPYGRDLLAASSPTSQTPAFLYRGESGAYPKTQTSMARALNSTLPPVAIADLQRLSDRIVRALQRKFNLSADQALGFLQHYGFPTEFLDATSDLLVAASFACSLRVGEEGALCIIPTRQLVERGELMDLRIGNFAKRPRLQSAFAIRCEKYPDMKGAKAISALKLDWLPFRLTHEDAARFEPDFALLDARTDELAGLIWLLIDSAGKFNNEAAKYLSERIDPAPVVSIRGSDGKDMLIAEDFVSSSMPLVDDEGFRKSHYENWSDQFAASIPVPLSPELLTNPNEIKPGAIRLLLSPRALGLDDDTDS